MTASFSGGGLFPARRKLPRQPRERGRARDRRLPPLPPPRQLRKGPDSRSKPEQIEFGAAPCASLQLLQAPLQQSHASAGLVSARDLVKRRGDLDQTLEEQAQIAFFAQPRLFPRLVRLEEAAIVEESAPALDGLRRPWKPTLKKVEAALVAARGRGQAPPLPFRGQRIHRGP
jgi:hypothetical protein